MTRKDIENIIDERGGSTTFMDGYDDAIVGYAEEGDEIRVVYDKEKCIGCLVADGMSFEDAEDYFSYNTLRSLPYVKENRPIVLYTE